MEQKLIFLDIDGTILEEEGEITDRTRFAIAQAQKKGHRVCIATGRCMAEIGENIHALKLDGYVCAAGAQIIYQGTVVKNLYLEKKQLEQILQILQEAKCLCALEGDQYLYISKADWEELLRQAEEDASSARLVEAYQDHVYPYESLEEVSAVNKISYFRSKIPASELVEMVRPLGFHLTEFSMDWAAGESGELTQESVHKGKAILELALYLGVSQKDTIAIGDSANDMEMLETAGVGIAMGNASPEVKDAADEVTGSVRKDGVYQAFVKHGLSSPYDDLQMEK